MIPITSASVLSQSNHLRTSGARGHSKIQRGHGWHNHCLEHVRVSVGAPPMGGTAYEAWQRVPASHRHPGPAPAGYPGFYRDRDGGAGHVIVSRGPSGVNTNDCVVDGDLDVVSWARLENWLGHNFVYIGYTTELNGRLISAPAPPKPESVKTVDLSVVQYNHDHHGSSVDTQTVKHWLHEEGVLNEWYRGKQWGSSTTAGYATWQRKLGYRGNDADGRPGVSSLHDLARRHNGKVKA